MATTPGPDAPSTTPGRAAFTDAIGSTPVVRLRRAGLRDDVALWVKLEGCNPGGSAKDRSAWALLQRALADGTLKPGGTIIESTTIGRCVTPSTCGIE